MSDSPSEGREIFEFFYTPQSAAEEARLTQAWYSFRMKEGEPPNDWWMFTKENTETKELDMAYRIGECVLEEFGPRRTGILFRQ